MKADRRITGQLFTYPGPTKLSICQTMHDGENEMIEVTVVKCDRQSFRGRDEMYRLLVIIEKGKQNYGAYSPDLPGCVAVGDTYEEVEKNMRKAIEMHLQAMIEDHEPIPTPQTTAEYMDITFPDSAA